MATYIRLTDYKSSDEKEKGFFNLKNRYEAKQEDFEKIPGRTVAYWMSNKTINIYDKSVRLRELAEPKNGLSTTNNNLFVREWHEVSITCFGKGLKNRKNAKLSTKKWFPYNKGGEFRKWYGNMQFIVDWENDGMRIRKAAKGASGGRIVSPDFYFNSSLSWSKVSSGNLALRFFPDGFIFDVAGTSVFTEKHQTLYLMAVLNSKLNLSFVQLLSPTLNFESGQIGSMPIIFPKQEPTKQIIDTVTQQNIDISKEEWDSRETSWDFAQNELLRILNDEFLILNEKPKLESVYNRYCKYWAEKHNTLHQNEEELNRLFIDIYELQDELTPVVELKDITILKNEAKIVGDELLFQADEILKQFISYGVGVMFGRYSLDHKGLHIANMNESLEQANSKFNIQNSTFEADDDNVIPVLEDDYFKDDIASRFVQFVKATFGEENLSENIRFIESSLGTTLRKYFVKGFYKDHIKRYKKRPIYWMVASPKKGFMSLIYMHRYKGDTFARVRNSYLTEYMTKLKAHKETLTLTTTSETASNADKKSADKQMKNIDKKLKEIIEFDRDKMMSWSQNPTEIDLDDGVKVNYCKFKDILFPITGLCR